MKTITIPPTLVFGSSATCPDLLYATGLFVPDPVVLLVAQGVKHLVVSQLEYSRASRVVADAKVYTPEMLNVPAKGGDRLLRAAEQLLKNHGIKRIRVGIDFPHYAASHLMARRYDVVIAHKSLFPQRIVKTQEEVRKIRHAQQAAVIGMRSAIATIGRAEIDYRGELREQGRVLTCERIKAEIAKVLFEQGCFCDGLIVAAGRQTADPHETGRGALSAGEPVVMDIFPRDLETGYWGDLTRTVVKGAPSRRLRRMYSAVRAAQGAALKRIKPGASTAAVHRAAVGELAARGFVNQSTERGPEGFIHSTGHGVGVAIHEAPSVGRGDEKLRPGMVLTVEPGLYYSDVGGIRIEDTVVVTSVGWSYLVPCEKRFIL